MNRINRVVKVIKDAIKAGAPSRTEEKEEREKRILNPSGSRFISYGLKVSQLDKIVRSVVDEYEIKYKEALEVFRLLVDTNVHDEKMAAISFISRFKRHFNKAIITTYHNTLRTHCNTWAFCDSSMIKVLGPYFAKKENKELAYETIKKWSTSDHLWVRRASLVIFLKRAMTQKDFNQVFLFKLLENMIDDPEDYIQKAVGWTLKTCSKYKPQVIYQYLMENHDHFSRITLRTASEKLSTSLKQKVLE